MMQAYFYCATATLHVRNVCDDDDDDDDDNDDGQKRPPQMFSNGQRENATPQTSSGMRNGERNPPSQLTRGSVRASEPEKNLAYF